MASAKGHWFHDMTPAQKKAYLAKHPNSQFGKKGTKRTAGSKKAAITKTKTTAVKAKDQKERVAFANKKAALDNAYEKAKAKVAQLKRKVPKTAEARVKYKLNVRKAMQAVDEARERLKAFLKSRP